MSLPGNGIFVVKGEMSTLLTAMKRSGRWSAHSYQYDDTEALKNLQELKEILNKIEDLKLIEPNVFLSPFLDVISSERTCGPVTSLALSAVYKFLSYGFLDPNAETTPTIVNNIADAVTHARFVGTDQSSDGVVLMRILEVLRILTLSPEGSFLTNDNFCEIMLSYLRICFETRLNELLRKTAEHYIRDMVQMVFMRLPHFSEDLRAVKHLKMRPGNLDQRTKRKKSFSKKKEKEEEAPIAPKTVQNKPSTPTSTTTTSNSNLVDMQGCISQNSTEVEENEVQKDPEEEESKHEEKLEVEGESEDFINKRGVRFTQVQEEVTLLPYGLASVRELFRFLISLCNPNEKQNTEVMIHFGLTLLTCAFEVGADSIGKHPSLLALVKDDLCRNLSSLLSSERLSLFSANLQVSFLMFESLRTHLKFQMEHYLLKLIDIIVSDSVKVTYEHKELSLDNILQLWKIPGFVTELYLNYDCDMYCTNLFEDLTKLLAKNAFSATSGVYPTHLLSLDALLTVVEVIEAHCEGTEVAKTGRVKISESVPSKEELFNKKNIKKWLPQGSEHFNHKPKKGIQFLQEHGVLKQELDVNEVALFLRENPLLDKKIIGEYISNRSNLNVLEAFVKTFEFEGLRIDEALRLYLEAFRLPGEAPTISLLLEHFAEHWHKSNGEPFADVDSAFTLAYAVIMLNVDQHNQNAKKQAQPMSQSSFKKNLKGVNGSKDFEEEMLDEIYNTIKNDEIVMPAEQTGAVKENYLWKVLLKKGSSKDGIYFHLNNDSYDSELFQIVYGPLVAALSFVFEKTDNTTVFKRVIRGFERCAAISNHFTLTKNLDMLILTLCKYTLFHNQKPNNVTVQFGSNQKAKLAMKTLFGLVHNHGDNVREGWRTLFDLMLSLYSSGLLPKSYVEAEDFIEPSGKILLEFQEVESNQKQDTGLLSSLYSYMVSAENLHKIPSAEDQQYIDGAKECIKDCNLDQLVTDSKFLKDEALLEMVKALIELSRGPDVQKSLGYSYNETVTVFFLEVLVKIVIQNRDRVMTIWPNVRDHIYTLVMNASLFDYQFLLERSVIGLLRIAIRLMRNEDMSATVLQSLRMLLLLKSSTLCRISRQISFGLYELLKTSAQNIHTNNDWMIIFTLLECVGAGAQPPKPILDDNNIDQSGTKSDGENDNKDDDHNDRGYTSDSELTKSPKHVQKGTNGGGWILVGNEGEMQPVVGRTLPPSQYALTLDRNLGPHDPSSLIKCCESLAFLVRDVAHITPYNFDVCVHCIRTFVEASLHGCKKREVRVRKKSKREYRRRSPGSSNEEDSEEEDLPSGYHQISIQLLDLMHTLHTRTAQIFKWWAEEGGEIAQGTSLWTQGWCPLLQGIARLCCDLRKQIRMSAITYLQRALLVHDLQTLTGPEWEACFHRVLFPLLGYLLHNINPKDPIAMEETRMRAATLLSKVFLHHLTPLLSLPTFSNLWLIILDFMDKYMHADKSDLLYEAIPESLKNMLLVMDSAGVFEGNEGKSDLWVLTWERINKFLPNMKEELFKEIEEVKEVNVEEVKPQQMNVETATRASIILQPPSMQQPVSSPLFAHLQMVSTPIGPNPSANLQQPHSMYTGNQAHTFPVLYNNPVIPSTTATEVQPVSIYSEYMGNPYNSPDVLKMDKEENQINQSFDVNKNGEGNNNGASFFQGSSYFSQSEEQVLIPKGSEIFYGMQGNIPVESKGADV